MASSSHRSRKRGRPLWLEGVHVLQLYGAVAITGFGWAGCVLLDWEPGPWVLLWFAGAMLAYNVDRLKLDPVDVENVPERRAAARFWRRGSVLAVALAATVLVAVPLVRGDWLTLGLVGAGAATCLGYSLPRPGRRLKDVPVLKTFIPPTVVAASIFGLPWLHGAPRHTPAILATAIGWAWAFLFSNMLFCDLRDLAGDRRAGTRSLPVLLGREGTRHLITSLACIGGALAWAATASGHAMGWTLLTAGTPATIALLLLETRRPRGEAFYEWWVEGMFFLPVGALVGEWLFNRV